MTAVHTVDSEAPRSLHFTDLPPELRSQIWRNALPHKISPAMFLYKTGCWQPRYFSESDEYYDPVDCYGIYMKYCHEFLDPVKVDVPLFHVNRESRGIAQAWMRQQSVEVRYHRASLQPEFIHQFEPLQDVLYVPADEYQEFCCEFTERGFKPDIIGQNYSHAIAGFLNTAIPEALFWTLSIDFADPTFDAFCPDILFIVINAHLDLHSNNDAGGWQHWGSQGDRWRALVWKYDHGRFDWTDGERVCDDDMYRRIEEAANSNMVGKLVKYQIPSFEIRPVLVERI